MKLRTLVLLIPVLYLTYAVAMFAGQERILFPASSNEHHALSVQPPPSGRLVKLPASFGNVRLFYQPANQATGPVPAVLYTHGNFECIQNSFSLVRPLVDAGISVVQLEFPGYCGADGDPSFANVIEAENRAYDWLIRQPGIDKSRIVAMGYSMGGGAACELTRHRQISALVLLSTYTSIRDMAHRYLLPGLLSRYSFDNLACVRKYPGPVFFEHGKHDPVIPFSMGRELAQSRPGSKFLALDCGHDNCHFDRSVFARRLPSWLIAMGIMARTKATLGLGKRRQG